MALIDRRLFGFGLVSALAPMFERAAFSKPFRGDGSAVAESGQSPRCDANICADFLLTPEELSALTARLSSAEAGGERALNMAIIKMLRSRRGAIELIGVLRQGRERTMRLAIGKYLAEFGTDFSSVDPYAALGLQAPIERAASLSLAIGSAFETSIDEMEDPDDLIAMVEYYVKYQRRRMVPVISREMAKKISGTRKSLDRLRTSYLDLFMDGMLPEFYYRRFLYVDAPISGKQSIRIAALGDFGAANAAQRSVADAMNRVHLNNPFDIGITLGDNFYEAGINDPESDRWGRDWEALYGKMNIPFYPVLGNHDYYSGGSALAEILYSEKSRSWKMLSPNYLLRCGIADLFAIDTNVILSSQLDWLERELGNSRARWKIVYGHHPIYSSGVTSGSEPIDLVGQLLPLLRRCGADMYISGHNHALEDYGSKEGVRLFTVGAGGAEIYEYEKDQSSIFRSNHHGFASIEISPGEVSVDFINIDSKSIYRSTIIHK